MPKVMNSPPTLREIQELMTERTTVGPANQNMVASNVVNFIDAKRGGASSDERLDIYADSWFIRLEESLAEDFPRLKATMKRSAWYRLIEAYLLKHPSQSYTLTRAGDSLPDFLAEHREFGPWQADLALLEKALYKAANSADVETWNVADLQNLAPEVAENLVFEFHPGAALIETEWNIDKFHRKETTIVEDEKAYLVVEREGYGSGFHRATVGEFTFLKEARDGVALGSLVVRHQADDWTSWLVKAVSTGLLKPRL